MKYSEYAKVLAEELKKRFGNRIDFILLFGSAARGENKKESDIDLLIVGDKGVKKEVSETRTKLDLEHGMMTTIIFKTREEFNTQRQYSDFLKEVMQGSRVLYGEKNLARA